MGIFFTMDMNSVIPFLLLGIGVDDMYVIVQAVDNLIENEKNLPASERVAKAMKHAGVSITGGLIQEGSIQCVLLIPEQMHFYGVK